MENFQKVGDFVRMKRISVGSACAANYADVVFSNATKVTKYGVMRYFKQPIILLNLKMYDFSRWHSKDGKIHLVMNYNLAFKKEIDLLMNRVKELEPNVQFKEEDPDDTHPATIPKDAVEITLSGEIYFVIPIYGIFTQTSDGFSYIQMQVRQISNLGPQQQRDDAVGELHYFAANSSCAGNEW